MNFKFSWAINLPTTNLNIANNLTVRVHPNCDPLFLKKAVTCLFTDRNGWPRFCNDESLVSGYMKNGFSKAVARNRIAVAAAGVNLHLEHQWEVTPELVMNLMMHHTLEKGLDITQCADLFTISLDGAGLAIVWIRISPASRGSGSG